MTLWVYFGSEGWEMAFVSLVAGDNMVSQDSFKWPQAPEWDKIHDSRQRHYPSAKATGSEWVKRSDWQMTVGCQPIENLDRERACAPGPPVYWLFLDAQFNFGWDDTGRIGPIHLLRRARMGSVAKCGPPAWGDRHSNAALWPANTRGHFTVGVHWCEASKLAALQFLFSPELSWRRACFTKPLNSHNGQLTKHGSVYFIITNV